jgi:hypothetical protein
VLLSQGNQGESRDTISIFIILILPGFPYEKKVKIGMVSPDSQSIQLNKGQTRPHSMSCNVIDYTPGRLTGHWNGDVLGLNKTNGTAAERTIIRGNKMHSGPRLIHDGSSVGFNQTDSCGTAGGGNGDCEYSLSEFNIYWATDSGRSGMYQTGGHHHITRNNKACGRVHRHETKDGVTWSVLVQERHLGED